MGMSRTDAESFAKLWQETFAANGNTATLTQMLGISLRSLQRKRAEVEHVLGISLTSPTKPPPAGEAIQAMVRLAAADKAELLKLRARADDVERLHELFAGGLAHVAAPPPWTHKEALKPKCLGAPTLFLSDLHWGESVDPKQINGVNQYDMVVARRRLKRVVDTAITMLFEHLSPTTYPGLVLVLGGDMVSGNIHEELRETNDMSILAIVLDLFDHLVAAIDLLLHYVPHIFIPCVPGNHGRLDKKPRAKGAVQDNFEWILYQMLMRHYADNKRVTVIPSPSLDYVYQLFNTTYLLTHGDQFKGGSGISGPFTPWMLGDHKKRKRQNAVAQPYDYMIFGHFHMLVWGPSFICNGSLKGYDEYSFRQNFGYECPQQALWITHPKHGITIKMEIQAEDNAVRADVPWVRVKGA